MKTRRALAGIALTAVVGMVGSADSQAAFAADNSGLGTAAESAASNWTPVPATDYAPTGSSFAPLNGHVLFSASGYKIDANQDQLSLVPAQQLSTLEGYLAKTNSDVAQGKVRVLADGTAVFTSSGSSARVGVSPRWSGPHGSVNIEWYGWKIYVDSYLANKIIGGTWTVAGISAALGVDAPVAAAIGAAAGVMQLCQDNHNGITFYYIGSFPTGFFGCNPFA